MEKKPTYTESQKKAIIKYRENNKDKINEQRKKYYNIKKENKEFMEYKRIKSKQYYHNKKKLKELENKEEDKEDKEEVKEYNLEQMEQEEIKPDVKLTYKELKKLGK